MTTWFTADTHFGHRLVSGLRGFDDIAEHDSTIRTNWASTIGENDTVWVLGDLAFDGWENRIELFGELPGHKHLVLGNHDRAHPLHSNGYLHMHKFLKHFDTVQTVAQVATGAGRAMLSHFPYNGDHGEERFDEWRLRDAGRPLVHGHTHSSERVSYSDAGTLQINVALEAWELRPVHVDEIRAIIAN